MYGDGSLYKRSGSPYWWMQYCLRGEVFRESTKERDEDRAQKVLRRRLKEVGADQIGAKKFAGPEAERLTVDQILDSLADDLEIRQKLSPQVRSKLIPLHKSLGKSPAMSVDEGVVREYVRVRLRGPAKVLADAKRSTPSLIATALARTNRRRPASNATVNRELGLLRQAFKLNAAQVGPGPAMPRLKERVREGFCDRAEFELIVSHLPKDLQDFARWGYLTGWRRGEIASLRWSELSMETRQLRLRGQCTKNGEPRVIPLLGELWEVIQRRRTARSYEGENGETVLSPLVFFRLRGRGVPKTGAAVIAFRKAWKAACEDAGNPEALFHDFRRTAVRNMVRAGISRKVAMQISGHKTESVFERYNITNDRDLEDAVWKIQEYVAQLPKKRENSDDFQEQSREN